MYAAGRANFNISVKPPLSLAANGSFYAAVPADVTPSPHTTVRYAVFTDSSSGPVTRHAHVLFSELPRDQWRWELETWARPESLSYAKTRVAGKYWTVQIMPVFSQQDWFSDLWQANDRQPPQFWLAKRWSSTPEPYMRIVAEYREPAPQCMWNELADVPIGDPQAPTFHGKSLWSNCDRQVQEFSDRADAAFLFDSGANAPAQGVAAAARQPSGRPRVGALVGRAESLSDVPMGND
jgi:hypothetical protein